MLKRGAMITLTDEERQTLGQGPQAIEKLLTERRQLKTEIGKLLFVLQAIQEMADEDLRTGEHGSLHQIEANARAALGQK
jgi:hypothetical protein